VVVLGYVVMIIYGGLLVWWIIIMCFTYADAVIPYAGGVLE